MFVPQWVQYSQKYKSAAKTEVLRPAQSTVAAFACRVCDGREGFGVGGWSTKTYWKRQFYDACCPEPFRRGKWRNDSQPLKKRILCIVLALTPNTSSFMFWLVSCQSNICFVVVDDVVVLQGTFH